MIGADPGVCNCYQVPGRTLHHCAAVRECGSQLLVLRPGRTWAWAGKLRRVARAIDSTDVPVSQAA